ncbi:MAG: response regulator [Vicinamibacteria bacterium]
MSGRLLLVDDQASILLALREYLEDRGFRVDCASTPAEADGLLDRTAYDVVIADLRLSAADAAGGLRLLRRVRERRPGTRTVLLTAYGSPEVEAEARRIGIDALAAKSHGLEEVAGVVRSLAAAVPDA